MSNFEAIPSSSGIPGTSWLAKNHFGIVVNIGSHRELATYEFAGEIYFVPKECGKSGTEYFDYLYIGSAFKKDAEGIRLPQDLLNRIREDMPQAYKALGVKCIIR